MSFIEEIKKRAKTDIKTIVLPEASDIRTLEATDMILKEGFANIILIGDEKETLELAKSKNLDISKAEIVNPKTSSYYEDFVQKFYELRKTKGMTEEKAKELMLDTVYFGMMMVKCDKADGLVSGAIHSTSDTLRPALQIIKATDGIKNVSSFFLMETPKKQFGDDGVLLFSDCGLIEFPTIEQLVDITIESAQSYRLLTGGKPRVALLSYSTKGSAKNAAIDKILEVLRILKERKVDFDVDGEFQLDAAIIPEVAKLKAPDSNVAGRANVLIFPNLESGNIGYKMAQRFGDTLALGPVTQGLKKPVNDLSRGSSVDDIVGTIIVTCMQAK